MTEELKDFAPVSAHRLDRNGSVVIGELMPYDDNQGERVRDDAGDVWCVEAESVRALPGWCNCQAIDGSENYPGPWHERGGEKHYPCHALEGS